MAELHVYKNPFAPFDFETIPLEPGARVIDWLVANYPTGCETRFYVNAAERDLDDLDYAVVEGDVVRLKISPAGLEPIYIQIIIAVVLAAASMALSLLLAKKPQIPEFAEADAFSQSPVYSIRSNQNTARLGEPVPAVYGSVLHTPDICAQPYFFYKDGKDQYFDMLLCLGQGYFDVGDIFLGDTPVSKLSPGIFQALIAPPEVHVNTVGGIQAACASAGWGTAFIENMITSPEVGDQEFTDINERSGWFRLGKSGQTGQVIFIDLVFPQGLYQMMDQGDITGTSVSGQLNVIETDINGNHVGTAIVKAWNVSSFGQENRNPVRITFAFDMGSVRHWSCELVRNTSRETNGNETNRMLWTGLHMQWLSTGVVYGNVTLMAVRMKATALAEASERSVKLRLVRRLPIMGTGGLLGTSNPADAFCDIMTNTVYGARRPLSEIDTARLATLRNYWVSGPYTNYGFNAIYTGKTTIWEALTQCLQGVAAAPLPLGGYMSITQDGPKPVRMALFSEQNIVRDSFRLSYNFDPLGAPDGVEVEYRDPVTFTPAYVRQPNNAVDPEKIQLFGCTDFRQAAEIALLEWQRRAFNRRAVVFETEMEGLIPSPGDRAAVQHTLPRWGQSGFVVGVQDDRLTLTLDRKLRWADFAPPFYMMFRSPYGGASNVVTVTRGAADDIAILSTDPWAGTDGDWALTLREELTHFVWGVGSNVVRDFILTSLSPRDDATVEITGLIYAPAVYSGTLAFLANPVP